MVFNIVAKWSICWTAVTKNTDPWGRWPENTPIVTPSGVGTTKFTFSRNLCPSHTSIMVAPTRQKWHRRAMDELSGGDPLWTMSTRSQTVRYSCSVVATGLIIPSEALSLNPHWNKVLKNDITQTWYFLFRSWTISGYYLDFYVHFISVRNNGQVRYFFLVLFLIFFITL